MLINTAPPGNAHPAAAGTRPPAGGALALLCLVRVQRPGALPRPGALQAQKGERRGDRGEGRPRRGVGGLGPPACGVLGLSAAWPGSAAAPPRKTRQKQEAASVLAHNTTQRRLPRTAGAAGVPPAARKNPKASPDARRLRTAQHPQPTLPAPTARAVAAGSRNRAAAASPTSWARQAAK